ncbi:hypothetical protein Poli38472_003344 [Pythium oligandrum]|uniref:Molecular chaperone Hsp33 n=1 Tax=Pythium oligandrum TaxID=41045 RepID=A0A8K1FDZ3_PYTOL|nr:hypothetical protein Poli38472_003344 [Pythium oligandrum]|eukprot:TMW57419.1 hypothetical protein Poli38472_003344 [Pythium oligandrum]
MRRHLRDAVYRVHVGNLRIAAVMARNTVAEGVRRWAIPAAAEPSRLWAEYMAGTVMLSSFFKGEERIKMELKAPDSAENIYVEAMAVGEVRGKPNLIEGSTSSAFNNGQMEVSKILYGATKPYVTAVPAVGNAEFDWQTFYDTSEQVPTAVRIGHALESDQLRCSGLTIQKMPDSAPHDRIYDLSDLRFDVAPFVVGDFKQNSDMIEYLNELIPGADLKEETCRKVPLDFYCRCSKKAFTSRLIGLGSEYLSGVVEETKDEGIELTCHFCNELYHFSPNELNAMISSEAKQ